MSTKELCGLLQEEFKTKKCTQQHSRGCQKLSSGKEAVDIIFGSIKPEDYNYFRNCYVKLKGKRGIGWYMVRPEEEGNY